MQLIIITTIIIENSSHYKIEIECNSKLSNEKEILLIMSAENNNNYIIAWRLYRLMHTLILSFKLTNYTKTWHLVWMLTIFNEFNILLTFDEQWVCGVDAIQYFRLSHISVFDHLSPFRKPISLLSLHFELYSNNS